MAMFELPTTKNEPLLWIMAGLNNLLAIGLLGISFLSGPPADIPAFEHLARLLAYISTVSTLASIFTTLILWKVLSQQQQSKWKIFVAQFALLMIGYLIVATYILVAFPN